MAVLNNDIIAIFAELADLLEIRGENPFKIRAYRNAIRTIESLERPLSRMVVEGEDLSELKGIGKDLAMKIVEIVRTGSLEKLDLLREEMPPHLIDLLAIAGLGPKRIRALHELLQIKSLEDLRQAATDGKIRDLHGFGEKLEGAILEGIRRARKDGERIKWSVAEEYAEDIVSFIKGLQGVRDVIVAGSFRRRRETIADLDILVTAREWKGILNKFLNYGGIKSVLSHGKTRATVLLKSDLQVDVRSVAPRSYGAALHYFTGSKAHNIAIRTIAVGMGLKINEYGVFRGEEFVAGETEEDVYRSVGLPYIEPELRENRGEIEAARAGNLPELITAKALRGDLHVHSEATDGQSKLEEIARAGMERGYDYLAVTDHSQRLTMVHGLHEERLRAQMEEIDGLNRSFKNFTLLKGVEVDILEDGGLDLSDSLLRDLDVVVGAVHYKFNLSEERQTERILRAIDNPHFHILAHPTGRLIGEREPYRVDMVRLIEACRDRGCFLELNCQPNRMDLNDLHLRLAKEAGVKVSLATDTHRLNQLEFVRYGIHQARRGWLSTADVLNTYGLRDLRRLLKRS
jgi:DNA polymerase (family 10)